LISLIKKISDHLRHWHKALWAYRISKHCATKASPFELVYGQETVFTLEISLNAVRIARQNDLTVGDYHNLMMDNIDEVTDKILTSAFGSLSFPKRQGHVLNTICSTSH
jgi:hypothetical protein